MKPNKEPEASDRTLTATLQNQPPCTAVSAMFDPASGTTAAGAPVTIRADAFAAGVTPQFVYWIQPTDPGADWTILGTDACSSATFVGSSASEYRVCVIVRSAGNVGEYGDAFTYPNPVFSYAFANACPEGRTTCDGSLCVDTSSDAQNCGACQNVCPTGQACSGGQCAEVGCSTVSLSGSADPAASDSTVTFTAESTCNVGAPLYRFSLRPPGGEWSVVQAYSSTATFEWNRAGVAPGSYPFRVDASNPGSLKDFDSRAELFVRPPSCPTLTASAAPSPAQVNSTVTLGAQASCDAGSPQYRFRVQPPNGDWKELRPYSSEPTFRWSTSGLAPGSYSIEVTAKHPDSTAEYDSRTVVAEELGEYTGPSASLVKPFLDCVATDSHGRSFAVFGYESNNTENVSVPIGRDNVLQAGVPGGLLEQPTMMQPLWFAPGLHRGAFVAELAGPVIWTVGGNSATADAAASNLCETSESGNGGATVQLDGTTASLFDMPTAGILPTETIDSNGTAAGKLDGAFQVTHDGTAVYSIPIWFPPAPLQPHLALHYNSQAGNGLYGLGWNRPANEGYAGRKRRPKGSSARWSRRPLTVDERSRSHREGGATQLRAYPRYEQRVFGKGRARLQGGSSRAVSSNPRSRGEARPSCADRAPARDVREALTSWRWEDVSLTVEARRTVKFLEPLPPFIHGSTK